MNHEPAHGHSRPGGRYSAVARILVEFLVIVAGVLAALAVDQWRESRMDRALERELLESLAVDIGSDSADFARLPERALGRVKGAEVLLRTFRPGDPRTGRSVVPIDTLGPYPEAASDQEVIDAFTALVTSSDLDVALGAYREFSADGGQRLVRNRGIRRRVHRYYYLVDSNLKFDPWVSEAIRQVRRRANDLGLAPGDNDAGRIRARLSSPAADPFFAAVRLLQDVSLTQNSIATKMRRDAEGMLRALRVELEEGAARDPA